MDPELIKLLEQQNKAFAEFKTANDERLSTLEKKGGVDPLLTEKIDKANKDISRLADELKSVATAGKRPGIEVKGLDGRPLSEIEVKHRDAVLNYVRKGDIPAEGSVEIKAMASSDDPNGGYLIPRDMSGRIVRKVFETSAIRQVASAQTVSTDALEGTYDDDELDGGWVGEQAARGETSTPTLGKWRIPVHEMFFKPKATQRLLDDSAVDIEMWLAGKVAEKAARKQENAFVVGDGVGKPRGIMTYAQTLTGSGSRASGGSIRTVKTGTNGDLPDSATDKLLNLVMALKAPYRANGQWLFSREGIEKVRLLKQDGKYIWAPSVLSADAQSKVGLAAGTLLGYTVLEANDLAAFATNALVGAFGDFAAGYQIVDRQGIRVLRDPYSAKPFVEFYTTMRVGGDVLNFEAFGYLKAAA
ncbi:phage major capsid protein [Caudoviricetes sp.]|nr:phage major capsid protein [Caudoviricetes sp.]